MSGWVKILIMHYQGFTTVDIRSHAQQYRLNGEFAGDLGDLMVMTVANILHIPLLIITNIQNMPVLVMSPSLSVPETPVPLYLIYNSTGPGHYDYAIPKPQPVQCQSKEKVIKCSCGRKSTFKGISCSTDKHGNCRCPCARAKLPCGELCVCKYYNNGNGQRPTPSQTRRKCYDNQRLLLRGTSGAEYMSSLNEEISILEVCLYLKLWLSKQSSCAVFSMVLIAHQKLYMHRSSKLCKSIDLPLFERSLRFISNYLKAIHVLIDLFSKLLK